MTDQTSPIELYYWPTPNGWKISIMLEELGIPYNVNYVNIGAGDQFEPEFLKIAPNNRMPAIIDPEGPDGKPDGSDVGSRIKYNRNSDVSILAHEMGHAVGQRTDTGRIINNLRRNPKLTAAIGAAAGLVPLGVAMANEGDDEYTTAALGALALHSPTIIDEALASKNALAMMNTAGIRASLGQRGLLAGALMSYMAAPIATASLGTAIGNQFDEEPAPM